MIEILITCLYLTTAAIYTVAGVVMVAALCYAIASNIAKKLLENGRS